MYCAGLTVCRCEASVLRCLHMGKVSCRMLRALLHLHLSRHVEHACECLIRCLNQSCSSQPFAQCSTGLVPGHDKLVKHAQVCAGQHA